MHVALILLYVVLSYSLGGPSGIAIWFMDEQSVLQQDIQMYKIVIP